MGTFINVNIFSLNTSSNTIACKALDDLIDIRLLREENQSWIEKAVITRIWVGTSNNNSENMLEQMQELFDTVSQNSKIQLSAPATHAAQTVSYLRQNILLISLILAFSCYGRR